LLGAATFIQQKWLSADIASTWNLAAWRRESVHRSQADRISGNNAAPRQPSLQRDPKVRQSCIFELSIII
jgi:hypothetical protein